MHGGATDRCFDGKSAARAWGDVGLATTATAGDRSANGAAQPHDRGSHEAAPRGRDPTGGSTGFGRGFGATNHPGGRRAGQSAPIVSALDPLDATPSTPAFNRASQP